MKTANRIVFAGLLVLGLMTMACGGGGGGGGSPFLMVDTDGDGLFDHQEVHKYGTSPILADTDGDGFSDYVECVEYGFDPSKNPVKFNPCVADVPKLGVNLTSPPNVALELTDSSGTTHSFETNRSKESAKTVSTSTTDTNTHSVEMSHTATATLGFSGWSLTGSVSYSFGHATTDETSHSYTEEQSNENRQTLGYAETYEKNNSISASAGILMVTAEIENRGDMSFRLDNLILGAVTPVTSEPGVFNPVGNLILDTSGTYKDFPEVTLGPGTKMVALNFINDSLDLETGKALLKDARSLVIIPSLYELTDPDGKAFAFNLTDIGAKTATIIIDYAGYRSPERYMVATNADPSQYGITVGKAMQDYLHIPYEAGEILWGGEVKKGLLSLRNDSNVCTDETKNGYWLVVHAWDNGIETVAVPYDILCPDYDGYDFEDIELKAGDTLHLVYVEDKDGDGIYTREEFLRGCSDDSEKGTDSDGDGIPDAEEIKNGTDPGLSDTDGDGLNDMVDPDPLTLSTFGISKNSPVSKSSYIVKADGTLWAWGANEHGQLGLGDYDDRLIPTQVGSDSDWVQVTGGRYHAAALKATPDGLTLWTWGYGSSGQLGHGKSTTECLKPKEIEGAFDWAMVVAGPDYTMALKKGGTLWVWGDNEFGQLGMGDFDNRYTPWQHKKKSQWLDIAAGGEKDASAHSFAINVDGSLWAWGSNDYGQLGIGNQTSVNVATKVGTSKNWVCIAAGSYHSIGMKTNGFVYTWGDNTYGQLGDDGHLPFRNFPEQVDSCFKTCMAGKNTSFGIRTNGTLWAWGCCESGQLGIGKYAFSQKIPHQVGDENEWENVSGCNVHTMGLKADGTVWTWGSNAAGQLGNGTTTNTKSPVEITSVIPE